MIWKIIEAMTRIFIAFGLIICVTSTIALMVAIAGGLVCLPVIAVFKWGLSPWIGIILEVVLMVAMSVLYIKSGDNVEL